MTESTTEPSTTELSVDQLDATPDLPNVPAIFKRLTQGEKLQLMQSLNVDGVTLGTVAGPAFMIAVVWKHRKSTTGQVKVADIVDYTDEDILTALGLTQAELGAQFDEAYSDADASKSDDA